MSLLIFVTSLTFITIKGFCQHCHLWPGPPNILPHSGRWGQDQQVSKHGALERQQSFDFFVSRLCAISGKISNSVLMTLFQAAICRKDRLCANYHAMQKKFGKKIFNFIPKVFLQIDFQLHSKVYFASILRTYHDYPRPTTFLRMSGYSNGKWRRRR